MRSVRIAVSPGEQFSRRQRLFAGLSELFSVEFEARAEGNWKDCAGVILLGVDRSMAISIASGGVPCLAFLTADAPVVKAGKDAIKFGTAPHLCQVFRDRAVEDETVEQFSPLKAENTDEIIIRKGGGNLWTYASAGRGADLVATECPVLAEGEFLFQHFQRTNWIKLFPLMHFVRGLSPWKPPQLRATFMFDDPNLHWKSYGYIQFEEMTQHAREHNYHVSFATVPLDAWYIHRPTAALFRENKSRLSLVTHGNNHLAQELAQAYSDRHRLGLATQALRRVQRFERIANLEVASVMVAPHGACSERMAHFLMRSGFEAACISRQSLMKYNKEKHWGTTIGLNLAEFVGNGFPVISRFGLSMHREIDFYLAAFLGKPIILDGHHEDVSRGLGIMQQLADLVNSFGPVKWLDMKAIARSNYSTIQDGEVLHVKMYSRRIVLDVPIGVKELVIQRPWLKNEAEEGLESSQNSAPFVKCLGSSPGLISVVSDARVEIGSVHPEDPGPLSVPSPRTPFWAIARRWVCEGRDRLKPTLDRLRPSQT